MAIIQSDASYHFSYWKFHSQPIFYPFFESINLDYFHTFPPRFVSLFFNESRRRRRRTTKNEIENHLVIVVMLTSIRQQVKRKTDLVAHVVHDSFVVQTKNEKRKNEKTNKKKNEKKRLPLLMYPGWKFKGEGTIFFSPKNLGMGPTMMWKLQRRCPYFLFFSFSWIILLKIFPKKGSVLCPPLLTLAPVCLCDYHSFFGLGVRAHLSGGGANGK